MTTALTVYKPPVDVLSYTVDLAIRSPYAEAASVYKNIIVPIICLKKLSDTPQGRRYLTQEEKNGIDMLYENAMSYEEMKNGNFEQYSSCFGLP